MKLKSLFIGVMIAFAVVALGATSYYYLGEAQQLPSNNSEKSCLANKNCSADDSSAGCGNSKAVKLDGKYIKAGLVFNNICAGCHNAPSAATPDCYSGLSTKEHVAVWNYEKAMSTGDSQYSKDGMALFESKCVECHELPDPTKPDCWAGMADEGEVAQVHDYMADASTGKALYESNCGSCHSLLNPSAHTADYWSKHLCTEYCTKRKFTDNEKQQMLLYLTTHSRI